MDRIKELEFFHGTSARAAASLLEGKANRQFLSSMKSLAAEIMAHLLRHQPEFYKLGNVFAEAGSEYPSAPLGIQELASGPITSTYSYDQMWVTTSFSMAAGYAKRHAHGSEAFNFLMDGIAVLEFLGEPSARSLLLKYPNLQMILDFPHEPVVLTISGLDPDRILSDRNTVVHWDGFFELSEEFGYEPSFRVIDPKAADVVGIRVLEGYNPGGRGQIPLKEDVTPLDPREWLANKARVVV